MKATFYDANGNPTGHVYYQTPFGMFWRWVGCLIIAAILGLVLLCTLANRQIAAENKAANQAAATLTTERRTQGIHCYDITWRFASEPSTEAPAEWRKEYSVWAASVEEARKQMQTHYRDGYTVVIMDAVELPDHEQP